MLCDLCSTICTQEFRSYIYAEANNRSVLYICFHFHGLKKRSHLINIIELISTIMNIDRNFKRLNRKFKRKSNNKMRIDKFSQQRSETQKADNPLKDIAGKFGGEFWLKTQSEIARSRQKDREETKRLQDTSFNQQD